MKLSNHVIRTTVHAKSKYLFDILILTTSCTVHGFENILYEVEEEGQDRVDTTFKLNVKGTTNFGGLALIGRITSEAGPGTGQSLLRICVQLRYNIHRSCKVL